MDMWRFGLIMLFATSLPGLALGVEATGTSGVVAAQMPPLITPQFRRYGTAEGVPSGAIYAIAQDHRGMMWFGSSNGLVRYDGLDFKVFRHSQDPDSQPLDQPYCLYVDRDNRIWMGAISNGLAAYDQHTGRFRHWQHDKNDPNSLTNDEVWSIAQTPDGTFWIATQHGLDRMRPDQAGFEHVPVRVAGENVHPFGSMRTLLADVDGSLWIGAESGLYRRWPDGTIRRLPVDPRFHGEIGKSWHIEQSHGEVRIDLSGGLLIVGKDGVARPVADAELASQRVTTSVRDDHGRLWLGTLEGALLGNGIDQFQRIAAAPLLPGGLPGEQLWQIVKDREGGLWFAFDLGGIAYLPPGWNGFTRYTHIPDDPHSLSEVSVLTIVASHDGQLWVGGFNGWIDKLDIATGQATHVLRGLSGLITAIAEDAHDRLWVVGQGKLYRYDHGKLITLDIDQARLERPMWLSIADDGRVFVASWREGIFVVDPDSLAITALKHPAEEAGSISQILFHDGHLWAASDGGLLRLDEASKQLMFVPGAPRVLINSMAFDAEGFWVGSEHMLLEHYRYRDGKAERIGKLDIRHERFATAIQSIKLDALGHLWILGQTGLWQFDEKMHRFDTFGNSQGLSNDEFNNGSTALLPNGKMFAASDGGVFAFDPKQFLVPAPALPPPLVTLSSLGVRKNGMLLPVAHNNQSLKLGWRDRDLLVNARISSYVDPNTNRFRFQLVGFDPSWVDVDKRGEREFAGLPAGTYSLQVMGAGADGAWSSLHASLLIHVQAAPWARWWAWLVYALIVVLLAWLVLLAWRRRLASIHHLQLAEQRQQLAEQASAAKSQFLATLSHEIRTPMTGVMGMAELLRGTPLSAVQREYTEAMQRSGGMLLKLLNDALDLARIEAGRLELEPAPFDPHELIDDVARLELGQARLKGLQLDVHVADDLPRQLIGDAVRIKQILLNLANNALKFTEQGSVGLDVRWLDGALHLSVSDTGPGIPEASRARLFQRFEQEQGPQRRAGSGLGLSICRELIALMGGTIELVSRMGQGSTFYVRLPLAATEVPVPPAPVAADAIHDRALRLLLVEDDDIVAAVIVGLLERQGHRVVHAANGLNALAELAQAGFDAVLLDLDLPGLDGFQIARLIRERENAAQRLPILAVTARSGGDEEARVREAGMDGFLRKPVSGEQLAQALAQLDRYRQTPAIE